MVIKVERTQLIRSIAGRIRELTDEHKKALAAYPAEVEAYCSRAVPKVKSLLEKLERGEVPSGYRYSDSLDVKIGQGVPERPKLNGEVCKLKGDLERLKLSSEKILSLRDGDKMLSYLDRTVCER